MDRRNDDGLTTSLNGMGNNMSDGAIIPATTRGLLAGLPDPAFVEKRSAGGIRVVWRFPNGYGASVIHGEDSYGVELAVLRGDDVATDTPVTDDVVTGIPDADTLRGLLRQIDDLPPVGQTTQD